jgi:5-carboxymethyl-2-hydroxymuconate isomerase
MPHVVIEYSVNAEPDVKRVGLTRLMWKLLAESGLFQSNDIKVRAYVAQDCFIGDKGPDGRFVHIAIAILEGRTLEQRQKLCQHVSDEIAQLLIDIDQITVDVTETAKDTYRKVVRT